MLAQRAVSPPPHAQYGRYSEDVASPPPPVSRPSFGAKVF